MPRIVSLSRWVAVAAAALFLALPGIAAAREVVPFNTNVGVGTVVVQTSTRTLYFVSRPGEAISYPVAVGRMGKQWQGRATIVSKRIKPAWSPTEDIKLDNPNIPDVIPAGAPNNPMGAAALILSWGQYAIHGTNNPKSIGTFASYGCIRMYNEDIMDLFGRVSVGTRVVVVP